MNDLGNSVPGTNAKRAVIVVTCAALFGALGYGFYAKSAEENCREVALNAEGDGVTGYQWSFSDGCMLDLEVDAGEYDRLEPLLRPQD